MKTRFEHLWLPPEYSSVEEVREDCLDLGNHQVARQVLFSLEFCSIASKGRVDTVHRRLDDGAQVFTACRVHTYWV
jgi:hypothetical protein